MKLPGSLNNAISYSWVLGWYAGRDGATTDNGKMQATKDIKEKHPDIVKACDCHDDLLAACKLVNNDMDGQFRSSYILQTTLDKVKEALTAAEPN